VLCAKSYKIKKNLGLMPLRKKIRTSSSSGGGCEFFFGSRGAGRGQAGRCDCMSTDHGPTELEFRTSSAADS